MKHSSLTLTIVVLMIIGGCAYGLFWCWSDYIGGEDIVENRTYSGRLYLQAEEYSQFKQYLAENPDVKIDKMSVYSSPDTLIDMSLIAPADIIVPYGEMIYEHTKDRLGVPILSTVLGGMVLLFIITTIKLFFRGI